MDWLGDKTAGWRTARTGWIRRRELLIRRFRARIPGGALYWQNFDGSIVALRKFTSAELLDVGLNVNVVAQRQGHRPQVLTRHYSKSRASADKRPAEHLGRVVHGDTTELPVADRKDARVI